MYNITFQQIQIFLTVARTLNISKAAESMYISQPTLTKALQRFEAGIGFSVFTRNNQGVALTPQGKYLYESLDLLYNNIEKSILTAKELAAQPGKILRVAMPSSFDAENEYKLIKHLLRRYADKYPDVDIRVELCEFRELQRKFVLGEIDVAFTHNISAAEIPGIKFMALSEYNLYFAISASHPLAAYDSIQPNEFAELTFYSALLSSEKTARERISRRCQAHGFTPKRIVFLENFMTLLHFLREKRGASVCGKFTNLTSDDLKYYPLDIVTPRMYSGIAWPGNRLTKEARTLINMLPKEALQADE